MARKFLTALDLGKNELQNAVVQNVASAPGSPVKGQIYYDSTANILYWWNGSQWIAAQAAAGATPAATVTTSAVADAAVVGVSTNFAREDHKHGREAFGAVTAQTTFGAAAANGAAVTLPRSDHVHGTPVHDATAHSAIPLSSLSAPFAASTAVTTFGAAKADGVSTSAARADHTHGSPTHDNAAHSAITLNSLAAPTGQVTFSGYAILGVGDPVNSTDAANKNYVDAVVNGLAWKDAARAATTANIATTGLQTIDGVSVIGGDRVLVKNQTTATTNGIYVVAAGAWSRSTDADLGPKLDGMAVFVNEGTVNADTAWVCTTNAFINVGVTNITYAQFGAGAVYTAGAGLTLAANQFDRAALTGDVTATAGANATTIANNAVTNAKAADMPPLSVKANTTGSTTDPADIGAAAFVTFLSGYGGLRKSQTPIGDGAATSIVVTHNFNVTDAIAQVRRVASPFDVVECDIEFTDNNTVTVRFATAPASSAYRVTIIG